MKSLMTRRHLFGLIAVGSGMALAACNSASSPAATSDKNGAAPAPGAETSSPKRMLVYRDPECGCCEAWADIARKAGYDVTVENRADMAAVKTRYGVPGQLASCHTAVIGGYAIGMSRGSFTTSHATFEGSPCPACRAAHREWKCRTEAWTHSK